MFIYNFIIIIDSSNRNNMVRFLYYYYMYEEYNIYVKYIIKVVMKYIFFNMICWKRIWCYILVVLYLFICFYLWLLDKKVIRIIYEK